MLDKLAEIFLKFPGVGPRQAKRFAYFVAQEDEEFNKKLADLILRAGKEVKQCNSCRRLFSEALGGANSEICYLCQNPNRNQTQMMVVEKDADLENIEKTGSYEGKYFVMGGVIPLEGAGDKEKNRLKILFAKIQQEKYLEVILANGVTLEGENSARYIEKILEPLVQKKGIKITRLGRGISTGTELEYIDTETMASAFEGRK